ncbi:hypothetical protein RB614_33895 [Phytohabitans sp. ZYX-F-186]|uniref:Thioesterase domain-containing protein n=1 Tax=Phytohabitans maris TaxID=3071409 RepID=A0ABU0ZR70_9ACTN|nr:thioesterase domain-containing protein [Phytohabitans sp. ZYX-F-186]MDQ7909524.1 hypothetical protein [Phytohabitans sp. ZYX-F-186]
MSLEGTPAGALTQPDLAELLLPTSRADMTAVETFPIAAFGGSADPSVPVGDVAAWGRHTESRFSLHTHPGGHLYLLERDNTVQRTLEKLCVLGSSATSGS